MIMFSLNRGYVQEKNEISLGSKTSQETTKQRGEYLGPRGSRNSISQGTGFLELREPGGCSMAFKINCMWKAGRGDNSLLDDKCNLLQKFYPLHYRQSYLYNWTSDHSTLDVNCFHNLPLVEKKNQNSISWHVRPFVIWLFIVLYFYFLSLSSKHLHTYPFALTGPLNRPHSHGLHICVPKRYLPCCRPS